MKKLILLACLIVMNIGVSLAQDRRSVPRFEATAEFRPPIQTSCSTLTSQREGDFCWDSDNDNLYIYTGSTWSLVGTTTSVSTLSGASGLTVDPDSDSNVGAGDFGGIVTVGSGDNADISFRFDQGTGQDPAIAWDDSAAAIEFDFDGTLADGLDPFFSTATLSLPTTLIFEGSTADGFETTFTATDPTSDATVTVPTGQTGTLMVSAQTAYTLGAGTDADTAITINQGTGTDPIFVWDDSAAAFEFDFDGALADGLDPTITTTGVTVSTNIIAEGSTADDYETTLTFTDPTADGTITIPTAQTGTLLVSGGAVCVTWRSTVGNPGEGAGATEYISMQDGTATPNGTETNVDDTVVPTAVIFHTLRVVVDVAPDNGGGTQSRAITLRDDAANTAVTCTISEAETSCTYTATVVTAAAGSKMDYSLVNTGTPATAAEIVISLCTGP